MAISARRWFALAVLVLALSLQGCNSLTRRLWSHRPMDYTETRTRDFMCYSDGAFPKRFFLEIPTQNHPLVLRIDNRFPPDGTVRRARSMFTGGELPPDLEQRYSSIDIDDFSDVPKPDRVRVGYDFWVFRHVSGGRPQDYAGTMWFLVSCDTDVTRIADIPEGCLPVADDDLRKVLIRTWRPVPKCGAAMHILKGLATPFTLLADVIVVPVSHVCLYIDLVQHPWT